MAVAVQPLTRPSTHVRDAAGRLFQAGWLGKVTAEMPHFEGEYLISTFEVPSEDSSRTYAVQHFSGRTESHMTCTCKGGRAPSCKHRLVIAKFLQKQAS